MISRKRSIEQYVKHPQNRWTSLFSLKKLYGITLMAFLIISMAIPSYAATSWLNAIGEFFGFSSNTVAMTTSFSVTPSTYTVVSGATKAFTWTFTGDNDDPDSFLDFTIPTGWPTPTNTNFIVTNNDCLSAFRTSITSNVVRIGYVCDSGKKFTVQYTATAPSAGTYTFTNTKGTEPSVTVFPTTSTILTSDNNTAIYGDSITLTATVTGLSSCSTNCGTVQFYKNGNPDGDPLSVISGIATRPISSSSSSGTLLGAGTYSYTAEYLPGTAPYGSSTSSTLSQQVNKATPVLSFSPASITYDGSAHAPTIAATFNSTSVSGSITFTVGGESTKTNAGAYPVVASFSPDSSTSQNFNSITNSSLGDYKILAAGQTASITNSPQATGFTGDAAVVCSGGGAVSGLEYTPQGSYSYPAAGTYSVTADCAATTNYAAGDDISAGTFVIVDATSHLEQPGTARWHYYNDTANSVISGLFDFVAGPGTPALGDGSARMNQNHELALMTESYQGVKFADMTSISYQTYVNGSGEAASLQFNVDFDLSDTPTTPVWQGRVNYEPAIQTQSVGTGWQTWDVNNGKFWFSRASNPANALNCTRSLPCTRDQILAAYPNIGVQAEVGNNDFGEFMFRTEANANSAVDNLRIGITGTTPTFEIYNFEKGTSSVSITCPTTPALTYNGAAQTPSCTTSVTRPGSLDPVSAVVTYDDNTNAGSHTATATYAGDDNYVGSTATAPFSIAKATPVLAISPTSVIYDGSAHTPTVSASYFSASGTASVAGSAGSVLVGGAVSQTNVGDYPVTSSFSPTDTTNFNPLAAGTSAGTFSITAGTQTASVTNSPQATGFTGGAAVTCSGGGPVSDLEYTPQGSYSYPAAGTYSVTADCAATTNYAAGDDISAGTFVIVDATPYLEQPGTARWHYYNDNSAPADPTGDSPIAGLFDFIAGYGDPELGDGSARMNRPNKLALMTESYQGVKFADMTSISYQTYVNGSGEAASLQFNVDYNLDDSNEGWQGRVNFTPGGVYGDSSPINGVVQTGLWQTWDVSNGKFWITRPASAPLLSSCTLTAPCTRAQLLAAYPNMGVHHENNDDLGEFMFRTEANANSAVDNLRIGITGTTPTFEIYDFEQGSSTTTISCSGTYTYTGSPITPTCSATVTKSGGQGSGTATISYSNNTNAGGPSSALPPTATATYAGDDNFEGSSAVEYFTIDKALPICSVVSYNVTYNGASHTATGTCHGVETPTALDLTSGLDLSGTIHINAGDYQTDVWSYTDATGNYYNASGTVHDVIAKADQTISFGSLSDKVYGDPDFTVSATSHYGLATSGANTGLTVAFASTTSSVCTVSGSTVHIVAPGTCSITASQSGDSNYNAATSVPQTFQVIFKPTLTVGAPPALITGAYGSEILVPVSITDLSPGSVQNIQFDLEYDSTKLAPVVALNPTTHLPDPPNVAYELGTVGNSGGGSSQCAGCTINVISFVAGNSTTPGKVRVIMNSAPSTGNFFIGAGSLISIKMRVIAHPQSPATSSDLNLSGVELNGAIGVSGYGSFVTNNTLSIVRATTSTALSSSLNPSMYGNSVTFTAQVSNTGPLSGNPVVNAGSVTFSDGLTPICSSVSVSSTGSATCSISTLSAGSHSITASYSGNADFVSSTSSAVGQSVLKATSSIGTITCSTAEVYNGSAHAGTVCSATYSTSDGGSGSAVMTYGNNVNASTAGNPATVTATYAGDSNHAGNLATSTFTIAPAPITATAGGDSGTPVTYDAQTHNPSACSVAGTYVSGVTCSNQLGGTTVTSVGPSPGTYTLTPSVSYGSGLASNYSVNPVDGQFRIVTGTVDGSVLYWSADKPVSGVTLFGDNSNNAVDTSATTGSSGAYSMTNFGAGSYTITPSKDKQVCVGPTSGPSRNGITSNDASRVLQTVVGINPLTGTALQAGKVSGSTNINSFDASLIAQKAVGNCSNTFNSSGTWKFIASSTTHSDVITGSPFIDNYTAYMMGDVDGDWSPSGFNLVDRAPADPNGITATAGSVNANGGAQVVVPVSLDRLNGEGVVAYQFEVAYDPSIISPNTEAATIMGTLSANTLNVVSNVLEPGRLKVVVYGAYPATGDGLYVNLNFTAGSRQGISPIAIEQFMLNDGSKRVFTVNGSVNVGNAQASSTSIRGRLVTPTGQGLTNARVFIGTNNGSRRTAVSSSMGYFQFDGLINGETYTLTVESRRFIFQPREISTPQNNSDELILVGSPANGTSD